MALEPAPRIMIMAGGTGGHVYPALAVAQVLRSQGCEVTWLGTVDRIEAKVVPAEGFSLDFISSKAVRGKGLLRWCFLPFLLSRAIFQAYKILKKRRPNVVLGMGGFAAGPGGIAAKLRGIPLCIHEQNAKAGLTNRWLAKVADKVMCGFPGAFSQGEVVGNPIRQALVRAASTPTRQQKKRLNILVLGGSQGAKVLNEVVPEAIKQLDSSHLHIWHQSGETTFSLAQNAYGDNNQVKLEPFINNMAEAYQWADVVIARSGALTVTELMLFRKPSLLVPLPYATDDHQFFNAQTLVHLGMAICIRQPLFSADALANYCRLWLEDRKQLPRGHYDAVTPNHAFAADRVASVCLAVAKLQSNRLSQ